MSENGIPAIRVATMIEVDRLMTESYGVHLLQMMEHAGSHLARLAMRRFARLNASGRTVIALDRREPDRNGTPRFVRSQKRTGV